MVAWEATALPLGDTRFVYRALIIAMLAGDVKAATFHHLH
jgi:hypothetical protein